MRGMSFFQRDMLTLVVVATNITLMGTTNTAAAKSDPEMLRAAKRSDGMLARYLEEAEGYASSGVDGYDETIRLLRTELTKREVI